MTLPNAPRQRQRVQPAATTVVQHTHKGEVVDEKVKNEGIAKRPKDGCGRVGVGGSVTHNMGDFNSVKVSVWAELPADEPGVTGLDGVYPVLSDWVDGKINAELDKALPEEK